MSHSVRSRNAADVLHVMDGWSATGASSRQRSLLRHSAHRHRGIVYGRAPVNDNDAREFVADGVTSSFSSRLPFGGFVWQLLVTSLRLAWKIVLAGRRLRRAQDHAGVFVHCHQGPVCVAASLVASTYLRAPLLYEEHVPLVDYGPSHQRKLIGILERLVVSRASVVITQTQAAADLLRSRTGWSGRAVVVPNAVDTELFGRDGTADRSTVRSRLGLADSAVLAVYSGFLDDAYNSVGELCALVGESGLADRHVHLVIAGDGPRREAVEECAAASPWIHYAGVLEHEEVARLLLASDIGLVLRFSSGEAVESLVPLKLYEMMSAGVVPIVADRKALAAAVAGECGVVVESTEGVGAAIDRALASWHEISISARSKVASLSWSASAESLDSAYEMLLRRRNG